MPLNQPIESASQFALPFATVLILAIITLRPSREDIIVGTRKTTSKISMIRTVNISPNSFFLKISFSFITASLKKETAHKGKSRCERYVSPEPNLPAITGLLF
jgi:hypothetical protein